MRTVVFAGGGFFVRRFPQFYPAIERSDTDATASVSDRMHLAHLKSQRSPPVHLKKPRLVRRGQSGRVPGLQGFSPGTSRSSATRLR